MGTEHTKKRLHDLLYESEFVDISSGERDQRKTYRAVRRRQLRAAELRLRRGNAMKKKLGIK